ncbi:MAG TPA: NYN domain-containing protein [Longimicrobiales bacterium]|nr:NYN domain-containing protein [Longimicrobiales bacterium]
MLKAGIFLDVENLTRNGGYGMRFRAVKELVEAQGGTVLRANAYMARDAERESHDDEYRRKKEGYRDRVRREGFHLVLKEVRRYRDAEGELVTKANADLDLAVDALLQAENLDYVLLGTGDVDFLRLVRALQTRGKRVDLLSFANTSEALRREVDNHFSGFLMPGVLPDDPETEHRERGILHAVNEEKGFGFLTVQTGLGVDDVRDDIFLHITDLTDVRGGTPSNERFAELKNRRAIIDFELEAQDEDRVKAVNAAVFQSRS